MPDAPPPKYELLELAGQGGMARVYRGQTNGASGFQRPVAIKRILDRLVNNDDFLAMFVEEARVASQISHPNVVQIHDFDTDDTGAYFLVMEWVEGINMLEWSRAYLTHGRHVAWPLVAAIGIEVLKGLGAAHDRIDKEGRRVPIYHRDVTPQNVLLSDIGYIKLTDFGLARAMDRASMTQPEVVKGKIGYLAPEILAGKGVSAGSDMYSLAIVLWEALSGRKLFDGNGPAEVIDAIKGGHVPPLTNFRNDVPKPFEAVLTRALSTDPARRYSSTRGMIRAMANILRMTPKSTGADVIAQSVIQARILIASQAQAVPLTRRK